MLSDGNGHHRGLIIVMVDFTSQETIDLMKGKAAEQNQEFKTSSFAMIAGSESDHRRRSKSSKKENFKFNFFSPRRSAVIV